jgi:hypothetical protein
MSSRVLTTTPHVSDSSERAHVEDMQELFGLDWTVDEIEKVVVEGLEVLMPETMVLFFQISTVPGRCYKSLAFLQIYS